MGSLPSVFRHVNMIFMTLLMPFSLNAFKTVNLSHPLTLTLLIFFVCVARKLDFGSADVVNVMMVVYYCSCTQITKRIDHAY